MRSHALVASFAALAFLSANALPATAKPGNVHAVASAAKSTHHIDYRLVGSYANDTRGQPRIVVAGKTDDGGPK
jgi:hypothetical protein